MLWDLARKPPSYMSGKGTAKNHHTMTPSATTTAPTATGRAGKEEGQQEACADQKGWDDKGSSMRQNWLERQAQNSQDHQHNKTSPGRGREGKEEGRKKEEGGKEEFILGRPPTPQPLSDQRERVGVEIYFYVHLILPVRIWNNGHVKLFLCGVSTPQNKVQKGH